MTGRLTSQADAEKIVGTVTRGSRFVETGIGRFEAFIRGGGPGTEEILSGEPCPAQGRTFNASPIS